MNYQFNCRGCPQFYTLNVRWIPEMLYHLKQRRNKCNSFSPFGDNLCERSCATHWTDLIWINSFVIENYRFIHGKNIWQIRAENRATKKAIFGNQYWVLSALSSAIWMENRTRICVEMSEAYFRSIYLILFQVFESDMKKIVTINRCNRWK